jgi:hypothetical protein
MPQSVTLVEVSTSFGRISRRALEALLTIHHGYDSLMLMSHAEYQRLNSRDRELLGLGDFTDEDRAATAASRAPARPPTSIANRGMPDDASRVGSRSHPPGKLRQALPNSEPVGHAPKAWSN